MFILFRKPTAAAAVANCHSGGMSAPPTGVSILFFDGPGKIAKRLFFAVLFAVAVQLFCTPPITAQEIPKQLQQRYDTAVADLLAASKEAKYTGAKFYHSPLAESEDWQGRWNRAVEKGKTAAAELKAVSLEIVMQSSAPSKDILSVAIQVLIESFDEFQYELCYQIANRLDQLNPNQPIVQTYKARSAILTNRFAEAQQFMNEFVAAVGEFPESETLLFRSLKELETNYQAELQLRESDLAAGDLPQVELETTQGKMLIELFEDQAPDTVGNFVYLVENGFYDEMVFHRVVKNFKPLSMVQVGLFTPAGPKDIGYTIFDEHAHENARHHLRGVLSMAVVEGTPNTGGSQFFMTLSPMPYLDGKHTVFGRIISDTQVLDKIHPTRTINEEGKEEPIADATYDKIIRARVLRKRNHQYLPKRVQKK